MRLATFAVLLFPFAFSSVGCKQRTEPNQSSVKFESQVFVPTGNGGDEQFTAGWHLRSDSSPDEQEPKAVCQHGYDCCDTQISCPENSPKKWVSCGAQSLESECKANDEEVSCSGRSSSLVVKCSDSSPVWNGQETAPSPPAEAAAVPDSGAASDGQGDQSEGFGLLNNIRSYTSCPPKSKESWVACNDSYGGCGNTSTYAYCKHDGRFSCYSGCDGYKCGGNCPATLGGGGGGGGGGLSSGPGADEKRFWTNCPRGSGKAWVGCIVPKDWSCKNYSYGVFCEGNGGFCDHNCNGSFKSKAGTVSASPRRKSGGSSGGGSSGGSSGGSRPNNRVTIADVSKAVVDARAEYNVDARTKHKCYEAGAAAGWSTTMQDYYCEFPINNPNIRECFTASVKGIKPYQKRTYPEAYSYCHTQGLSGERPMKWIYDNQDAVFRAVMIDKKF